MSPDDGARQERKQPASELELSFLGAAVAGAHEEKIAISFGSDHVHSLTLRSNQEDGASPLIDALE